MANIVLQRVTYSERQSVDWFVGEIKGTLASLKVPLAAGAGKSFHLLTIFYLLFYF